MGWASGGQLFEDVWITVRNRIPKEQRVEIARELIQLFEGRDCDVLGDYEIDEHVTEALRLEHPSWYEEDNNG